MPPELSDDALAIIAAIEQSKSAQTDDMWYIALIIIGILLGYMSIRGLTDPWR